jgi:AAA domain
MQIKRVDFRNLKGASDAVVLGPATLIYGPNLTGKTTITDAIKLALLGYHPALDKTAAGIMELASGDDLMAGVLLDDKVYVGHVWTRAGGRITKRDQVPLDWPEQPVAVLDAAAYFGLSDRGKVEYLFRVSNVEGSIDQTRKLLDTYGDALGAEIAQKVGVSAPLQKWLDGAVTVVEALRSEAAATAKRFQHTQQGTVQLSETENPPQDLPIQIDTKTKALDEARRKLRDLEKTNREEIAKAGNSEKIGKHTTTLTAAESSRTELENERRTAEAKWKKVLERKGVCPMCGTDSKDWHKGAEKMRDEQLKGIARRLTGATEQITATRSVVEALRKKATAAMSRTRKKHANAIEALELEVAELSQGLSDLNKQQYRYGEYVAERRKLTEARDAAETASKREAAFRGIKLKLVEAKARLLEATFGPLLATVAIFTQKILKHPIEFREGELGYRLGDAWIPWRTFGGTEQAVAFTAFQAALAARAPVRVAILDELGRLDKTNKGQLLKNVLTALSLGVIDQFIGIDTELSWYMPPKEATTTFLTIERK